MSVVPEDGKANEALEAMLAKSFGVSRGSVAVIAGHTARNKQVQIVGDIVQLIASTEQLVCE